ncbi:hypothetical protein DSO57_1010804 [Entomophthora muscae]|uniref:Uncharacterized protein n=1 Tax=Entomophthora muscae TaxID=34485 RepID=A0ACC2RL89_9FUNG|nr:hypothetical protein DSO57_1010804 [Entomophthora muscae]
MFARTLSLLRKAAKDASTTVATKFPDLPANISYNTQGALGELPLDVSNNMDQSDCNIKLQERYQFDLLIPHGLFLGSNAYMEHATMPPSCGLVAFPI